MKKTEDTSEMNFLGTYLTENGSTAVVVTRSAMVVNEKKQIIWVGFLRFDSLGESKFNVWDKEGKSLQRISVGRDNGSGWDLKEAIREQTY